MKPYVVSWDVGFTRYAEAFLDMAFSWSPSFSASA